MTPAEQQHLEEAVAPFARELERYQTVQMLKEAFRKLREGETGDRSSNQHMMESPAKSMTLPP